jgi:hypothetical protein
VTVAFSVTNYVCKDCLLLCCASFPQKMIVPASDALSITQNSSCSESRSAGVPPDRRLSPRQIPGAPLSEDVPPAPACDEAPLAIPVICLLPAVPLSVGVAAGLLLGVGASVDVPVGCGPGDAVPVGVGVSAGVTTGVGVTVGVIEGVGVLVGVTGTVGVMVGIGDGGSVGVTAGEGVGEGVAVGTLVGVTAGVSVGVGDTGAGVGGRMGVCVITGVGVCCGCGRAVGFGVGSGVARGLPPGRPPRVALACGEVRVVACALDVPGTKHGLGMVICVVVEVAASAWPVGVSGAVYAARVGRTAARFCAKKAPQALPAVITSRDILMHRLAKTRAMTLNRPFHPLFQSAIMVFIIFSYPSPQNVFLLTRATALKSWM